MPSRHRNVLTAAQRHILTEPPADLASLVRHYTLTPEDRAIIDRHRRPRNRLGFAIQLCYLRFPGHMLRPEEDVPASLLAFVAEQLGVDAAVFGQYARRGATRYNHLAELQSAYGFRSFTQDRYRELAGQLLPTALANDHLPWLIDAALETMRLHRIIVPVLTVVERLCAEIRLHARRQVFKSLAQGLTATQKGALDGLLDIRPDSGQTWLTWLRQSPGAATTSNLLAVLDRLDHVRALGLEPSRAGHLHQNRLLQLVREAGRTTAQHLADFEPLRRHGTLTAMALELTTTLTDDALDLADRLIGGLFRKAEHRHAEAFQRKGKAVNGKVRLYAQVGQALITARETQADPFAAIAAVIPWERFVSSVEEAAALVEPDDFDHLEHLAEQYPAVRRWAPRFLNAFVFTATPTAGPLLEAIVILRRLNTSGQTELPAKVPAAFVRRRWHAQVFPEGARKQGDRRFYELCVLAEVRDRLRAGDVWVTGSRQYRNFEEHLISRPAFQAMRKAGTLPLAIDTGVHSFLDERRECLHAQLSAVAARLARHDLPDVRIGEDGDLHISPIHKAVPEAAEALADRLYARLPRIRITDLLLEVDSWTDFSARFTHLRSGVPATDRRVLLTGILADAINLGLVRMAEACPVASWRQLLWTATWHVCEDGYSQALATIIDAQHRQPLAGYFGSGGASSSDGQQFRVGGHGHGAGEVNTKYGQEPGIKLYTHVSDRYSPYHVKVISATASEALYIIDGLLYHESSLDIREHYTDTAGATDNIFAVCALLGFRFAPRIRDLQDRRLYVFGPPSAHPVLEPLIGGRINLPHLEAHWEEILRLATSIRTGTVTASAILRKLAAYPRQNGLALALRELGRIERTLFTLQWLQDPALRRSVTAGLNKGEAYHALTRAVCFHRLGEIRDRSYENQRHRAGGLNLVVAAIILWNTVYLEKVVSTLRTEGENIPDDLLAHLSPLGWEHVNLTGDYVWSSSDTGSQNALRPLRHP